MEGFDPKFKDFPDYIIGITKEIWEDRGISTLHHYYAPDIVLRTPAGMVFGNQGVIGKTMSTLAEFPDRTLLGEDVIWSGTPQNGMLSSHRLHSTATHAYEGYHGKATGKKLHYRIIADCHAINNQINDEWLVRDQGHIVRQLGWEPEEFTRDLIAREGGPEACPKPFIPEDDVKGPYSGKGNDNAWGAQYADILSRIMHAEFSVIPSHYDRAANLQYPGGLSTLSHSGADRFWMGLRSAFPDAEFTVHHVIGREDAHMPPRAASRWSLWGKHDGWGAFGPPSGAMVHVMGMSHAEFGPWGLRREWVLFDETAIWKQILLHTGDL